VLDIHHEGVASQDDIDDFAEQLLILRLGQLKSYNVEKRERDKEPQCTSEGVVAPNVQQITIGSDANHYVVKASIITREPEKGAREAVLNYELLKCRKSGERVSLAQNNHTFPYTEVLSHLNSMADAISFELEQEQEVTKIRVDVRTITGAIYGAKLSEMFMDRLTKAQEFEPHVLAASTPPADSSAEYIVSGRVFSQSSKLWFEIEIRNRRGRTFKKVFEGPVQSELTDVTKLEEFYKDKSLLALDYLTFVRNIADTDQPPPRELEAEKALGQARELLCKASTSSKDCVSQASPAADLLVEVVRNKKFNTWDVWDLLGGAFVQANENGRAGDAFERAAGLAELEGKSTVVAELLSKAGTAWLESRNLDAAGLVYDRLLKMLPSSPDARLGRAKTYRYNNERVKELEFLLDSIDSFPDAKELNEELKFLAGSLLREEIGTAMKILDMKKEKPSAALALPLIQTKQASFALDDAIEQYEHKRYEGMNNELKKAEGFLKQLPDSSQETITVLELRGLWYRDARGEFDTALQYLRDARLRIKGVDEDNNIEEVDREIALTLYRRGIARTEKSLALKDFEDASAILTESAKRGRELETIGLLRVVNHQLGKDKDTKDLIQRRIEDRLANVEDFLTLGFMCASYEADAECELKVAAALKESRVSGAESYSSLLRAEALTLKGEYDLALSAQQEALSSGQLSTRAIAVAHFYGVLLNVAKLKQFKVSDSATKWQLSMRELRQAGHEIEWLFDGALRAIEADASIEVNAKTVLRDMVSAMQDSKKTLPEFPLAQ